ncbi:MAG: TlpA disulfide reductase family protein [Bacteroidales bacterium]|nr:TlpA disulfide reductase family protein [Bacteroidales bacterium]
MQKILLFLLSSSLLLLGSCGNSKKPKKDEFIINGSFFNANESMIILEELRVEERVPIDSVKIEQDGSFTFKVKTESIGFYVLKMNENNFVTLLIEPQEVVEISADARQITSSYTVSGSPGSEKIRDINVKLRDNYARVDSLRNELERTRYFENFEAIKNSLDSVYFTIVKDQKDYVTNFIDNNTNSLASLIALYQSFGQTPVLSEQTDFVYFEKLADGLISTYPDNPHSLDLFNRVEQIKVFLNEKAEATQRLLPGNIAPEIVLNNINDVPTPLSSLRGKVVLIDFWAAWCAPCRAQNPELLRVYKKFKNKNFEIYGVSLDRDKESWKAGITGDKIDWIHVSDLLYWQSPVVKQYNVEGIPASYLIDKDGKILYKDLEINELERILTEIL